MITIAKATFAPDLPPAPGGIIAMTGFAPSNRGTYVSVATNPVFDVTGTDALHAQTFRQVNDSVRLLVFRKQNIDEYSSLGVRTNRGTGYNASTADWDAAAWGNQIIAVNYLDAPQSSTGAGFSALAGSPPKARCIAANINFVMLGDVNDGGSNVYSDMVWWSALQNPESWAPSIATQAGNYRLLDAPGPIKRVVAFRDRFVAFKENAVFVGEYVGAPFIFQWRLLSSRVGLIAPNAVCELDDKLYFAHFSGVYEFDGAQMRNVSLPVWQTLLRTFCITGVTLDNQTTMYGIPSDVAFESSVGTSTVRMVGDDIEGVLWVAGYTVGDFTSLYRQVMFGYNVRTGDWCCLGAVPSDAVAAPILVSTTHADMRAFVGSTFPHKARVWYLDNKTPRLADIRYPDLWGSTLAGQAVTAVTGASEGSTQVTRVYPRCVPDSYGNPFASCEVVGYADAQGSLGEQTVSFVRNDDLESFDGQVNSRFRSVKLIGETNKLCHFAAIGIEHTPQSNR